MTLTQLEYVIAVDTYRHFGKAAAKSFVTQPTLSMQIHKLEEELGVSIFDRSKKPVKPTELGAKLIEQARTIILEANRLKELVTSEMDEVSGSLRLGIIPTLAPYLLPLFIQSFTKANPRLKLIVEELQTEQIVARLKSDTLDAGLLVTPLDENGITERPLFYEPFFVYAAQNHMLAHKEAVRPEDLKADNLWLLNQGHCFRNQMINLCGDNRSTITDQAFEFESGSLETLKRLVEQEYGYTLLPALATQTMPANGKGVLRPFTDPPPVREVSLVMRRNHLKKQSLDALAEAVKHAVPPELLEKPVGEVVEWR